MKLEKSAINPFPLMTTMLLYTNVIVFLLVNTFPEVTKFVYSYFASYNTFSPSFEVYQIVSHMFLHGGFTHLFYNMLILWIFGMVLEHVWGKWNFLLFYFVCGLGAWGLHQYVNWLEYNHLYELYIIFIDCPTKDNFHELIKLFPYKYQFMLMLAYLKDTEMASHYVDMIIKGYRDIPTIGASGAVFGVLAAFGLLFGETLLYVYFVFPIKAKWFVAFFILLEVVAVATGVSDNVAHFAHIGGALTGIVMILAFKKQFRKNNIL